jgi:hypothetical protein
MKHERQTGKRRPIGVAGVVVCALSASGCMAIRSSKAQVDTTPPNVTAQSPELLSAFFGLDHALPARANLICSGAEGQSGMPVVFPLELDIDTLQSGDFAVRTKSGQTRSVLCVSPAPALDAGELRTILLIGDFGSKDDPPVAVEIVGNLLDIAKRRNFRGRSIEVIPLSAGPTMVLAEVAPNTEWSEKRSRRATACPPTSKQVVRVTWTGGVTRLDEADVGGPERLAYRVQVMDGDGAAREIVPFALADLDDGDNNHDLCLDTEDRAVSVSFPAGLLVDPAKDLNPATNVEIRRP